MTTNFRNCQMNMTQFIGQNIAMSFQTISVIYSDIMVALGIVSHVETMGQMPMFTQKLSEIFYFFDLDQISDMCSFGVSIGFLPLVRIVWIKECLF